MKNLSIIVAMDKNRLIGKDNDIPWHIPHDLKHFKNTTTGHTIIMGRKTYESLPKPLPNRPHIVITSDKNYTTHKEVKIVHSIEDAILAAPDNEEVFVVGGAKIYEQFLDKVNKLYLTFIDHAFEGDTYFPEIDFSQWELIFEEHHQTDDKENHIHFTYKNFQRKL